ncbi:MAG: ABC transporter permease subunit [Vannielia sp.]|uniref:ABC transporter permease n=1 Tax=Rhodobacterales TaxID=204455 RepID=UPI0020941835|nr:ABC transporter permease subunit [Oceanicola sp. 502str15]MCO6381511.1 ABC transporter permease subunit [Oceanicola sp. 502str15]
MTDVTPGQHPYAGPAFGAARRIFWIAAPFVLIAAAWQIAAAFFPPFLFPSLIDVFARVWEILTTWSQFSSVLATALRILGGLAGAFVIGAILGITITNFRIADKLLTPTLTFFQGIPALSWVVFAIIWFHGVEFRIIFIMIMTTLPAFTFQTVGALRGMDKDLSEMVMSFRPGRVKYFTSMVLPAVLPEMLTAWKVNLGNASRVVVVAELVGSSGGVGYQLLQQQQLFDMAGALAWTLQLVFFVLLFQWVLSLIERAAFRYRAISERH